MIDLPDPDAAKLQWGQPVWALVDLYNDGSMPGAPEDGLLIVAGGPGEVVQVGRQEAGGAVLYMVDFGLAVLGCREDELSAEPLAAADPPAALAAAPTRSATVQSGA